MSAIGKVNAVFTASTSGLRSGVSQAAASMKTLQGSVAGLRSGMSTLVAIQGAQFFAQIAGAAIRGVQSLTAWGNAEAQVIDRTAKLSQQLGFTYGELAGLGLAAQLAGVDMEIVSKAVTKANVAFANASNGSKQAIAAFERIGLSVDDLNGLSASDQFDKIAAAIAALPTQAERAAAAVAIFGRSGAELLPLFQSGAGAIAAAREEAERFGLTLTNDQAANVEKMNDAFTRAQSAVQGVVQQVVAYLAPAVESVTTAFSDLIGSVGGATIGQTIGDGILQGARYLAEIGDFVIANFSSVFSYLSSVGEQWAFVWDIAGRVGSLFAGVGRTLAAAFQFVVGTFSTLAELFLKAVRSAARALGFDTKGLDTAIAGLRGFNQRIARDIRGNLNAAAENFSAVVADSTQSGGEALAGPLTSSLDAAIASARNAADAVSTAAPNEVKIDQTVEVKGLREAVQGIEANSAEGIREMFRIMRGDAAEDVDRQQLTVLERIAAGVDNIALPDLDVAELAPAAGG